MLAKLTIDFCRAGLGSIKDFDETDLESIMEVLACLGAPESGDPNDEVLAELRERSGR